MRCCFFFGSILLNFSIMASSFSDAEVNRIKQQAAQRAELRREFFKQRTNPWKHSAEAGYVFDPAIQRFISMKVTTFERFVPNKKASLFGMATIIIPMFGYGYIIWNERAGREEKIRKGEVPYRDRLFKLI